MGDALTEAAAREVASLTARDEDIIRAAQNAESASRRLLARLDELAPMLEAAHAAVARFKSAMGEGGGSGEEAAALEAARNLKKIYARIDAIGSRIASVHGAVETLERDVAEAEAEMGTSSGDMGGEPRGGQQPISIKAALANVKAVGSQVRRRFSPPLRYAADVLYTPCRPLRERSLATQLRLPTPRRDAMNGSGTDAIASAFQPCV